jgi:hypothetical protein
MSLEAPATLGELIERRRSVEDSRQSRLRFTEETIDLGSAPQSSAKPAQFDAAPTAQSARTGNWATSFRDAVRKLFRS